VGDVLIIGAGGGNDVAIALAQGATHVDAVEIDPKLYELGKAHHPDRPYDDPRVDIHIDDGRAFLERSSKKYDRILLALPDSITLVQGQSSLRLESYLFTSDAIDAARDHLKEGGVFSMYNFYLERWLVDRFANTLAESFDTQPCINVIGEDANLAVLQASSDPAALDCPADQLWTRTDSPSPATDDWPFPYLENRSLPTFYLVSILLILAVTVLSVRAIGGPLRPMAQYADLFFMGAAFLLLETKNVVQFALLFGTTWFVNALVFLGVLLSVLVAVGVSRRTTFKRPELLYAVLLASLVVAWLLPAQTLLELSLVPRFVAAVLVAFFPIFTANLIFTQRFKATSHSTTAFGANLLGAMVGGLLEYFSLVTGYRALLIAVALLYGAALLVGRRHLTGASVPAHA
jgi:tRNA1(Val) A37 N6-methylase TrmN6